MQNLLKIFLILVLSLSFGFSKETQKSEKVKSSTNSIAVMPFRVLKDYFLIDSKEVDSIEVERGLNQALVSLFSSSGKFKVLDRDYLKEHFNEKDLILYDSPLSEQVKIGKSLGSDYLIVGRIERLELTRREVQSKITSQISAVSDVFANVSYRVLSMKSGEVKVSDSVNWEFRADKDIDIYELYNMLSKEIYLSISKAMNLSSSSKNSVSYSDRVERDFSSSKEEGRESDVELTRSGGVVLPADR